MRRIRSGLPALGVLCAILHVAGCASTPSSQTPPSGRPAAAPARCQGTLGLEAGPLSRAVRKKLALPDGLKGAVVLEVLAGGPAAAAGILAGDVVTSIGGEAISNDCEFDAAAFGRACEPVAVAFRRLGVNLERNVSPADRIAYYEKACAGGIVSACYRQAWVQWARDAGDPKNQDRALELYQKACLAGSGDACADEGRHLMDRPERANDALAVLELSCDLGSGGGCANFAFLYATGKIVKKDDRRATALYVKSCDLGDAKGCYNAGVMSDDGRGVARDVAAAVARYEEGCAGGSSTACTNLGFHYENGQGVRKDAARAVELYQRGCDGTACQPSNLAGCVNVGRANRDGIGVAKNPARAATIFETACRKPANPEDTDSDSNRSRACSLLGGLYLAGDGVEKDVAKGRELSELGCEGFDTFGCFNAAVVATDPAKAAGFLDRACQRGDGEACRDLGVAYDKGNGVAKDRRKAAELSKKACELGFKAACGK